jgi:hypothetical protein
MRRVKAEDENVAFQISWSDISTLEHQRVGITPGEGIDLLQLASACRNGIVPGAARHAVS